jgi:hypothetical protein
MNTDLQPHQAQIQRAGKILWGFSWVWLVLNALAFVIVIITTMALGLGGNAGAAQEIVEAFSTSGLVPDVSQDALRKILAWDFQAYLDNLLLTSFWITFAAAYFIFTMTLILRIAAAWKRGDVFGAKPIRTFRLLGWVYLIHGIVGQAWGMIAQFVGNSNTCDLIYFSFIRDVCLMAFCTSGTGIEWGCLALSWMLEHARLLRHEQDLVV